MSTRRQSLQFANSVFTSDTTLTPVVTYNPPAGSAMLVECVAVGRDTETGKVFACRIAQGCRQVAGTVTFAGSPVTVINGATISDAALVTCTATLSASGGTLAANVTGVVATTIDWYVALYIHLN